MNRNEVKRVRIPERTVLVITTVSRGNVDGAEWEVSSNLLFDFYVPSTNVKRNH